MECDPYCSSFRGPGLVQIPKLEMVEGALGGICDPPPETDIVKDEKPVITDLGYHAESAEVDDEGADGEGRRSVSHEWPFCP